MTAPIELTPHFRTLASVEPRPAPVSEGRVAGAAAPLAQPLVDVGATGYEGRADLGNVPPAYARVMPAVTPADVEAARAAPVDGGVVDFATFQPARDFSSLPDRRAAISEGAQQMGFSPEAGKLIADNVLESKKTLAQQKYAARDPQGSIQYFLDHPAYARSSSYDQQSDLEMATRAAVLEDQLRTGKRSVATPIWAQGPYWKPDERIMKTAKEMGIGEGVARMLAAEAAPYDDASLEVNPRTFINRKMRELMPDRLA